LLRVFRTKTSWPPVAAALASAIWAAPVGAVERHYELRNTSWQFLLGETGVAAVSLLAFAIPARDTCGWCEANAFEDGIRDALRASNPRTAGHVSHVFAFGAAPLVAAGGALLPAIQDRALRRAGTDLWILANTLVFNTGFNEVFKRAVGRQRPAFHYGVQGETEASDNPAEENRSFFSLDTSFAFSAAACGTTLAYLHGYEIAPWILGGGAAFATTAGVLRIAADMHWATDVIVGALAGTAVGVSVPLALHRRESSPNVASFQMIVLPQGVTIFGTF
jgi:membrane-associated phospholipid phosphatase